MVIRKALNHGETTSLLSVVENFLREVATELTTEQYIPTPTSLL